MPDVPRATIRAPINATTGDDATANTGPHFHEERIVETLTQTRPPLSESQDVDVVVDVDRARIRVLEERSHTKAVPPRHDRRGDRFSAAELNRSWYTDSHAPDRKPVDLLVGDQCLKQGSDSLQYEDWTIANIHCSMRMRKDL